MQEYSAYFMLSLYLSRIKYVLIALITGTLMNMQHTFGRRISDTLIKKSNAKKNKKNGRDRKYKILTLFAFRRCTYLQPLRHGKIQ